MFLSLILNAYGVFNLAKDQPKVLTEGIQFKMTYKVTAGILIFASSLLSLNDAFGKNDSFKNTVWKIEKFSATQILREINFGGLRSFKTGILAILDAPNFDFW